MTEAFEGWRVWTVRPCTDREKLPNALIFDAPPLCSPHELTQWQSRTLTSKCPVPQRHSESCFCGIHVVENVVDVLYRATHTFRCISEWVPLAEMPAIVVGRVVLEDARPYTSFITSSVWAPEWRGEVATVGELFLPYSGSWDLDVLARLLRGRYSVPVTIGKPPVTDRDRESAPAWLSQGITVGRAGWSQTERRSQAGRGVVQISLGSESLNFAETYRGLGVAEISEQAPPLGGVQGLEVVDGEFVVGSSDDGGAAALIDFPEIIERGAIAAVTDTN